MEREILLGVIVVMFDFKKQMTVLYKPKPAEPSEKGEVIGEGKAASFYFLVFTTPDHPDMKFTRYLTTAVSPEWTDATARALNARAVKAADAFMRETGGLSVEMSKRTFEEETIDEKLVEELLSSPGLKERQARRRAGIPPSQEEIADASRLVGDLLAKRRKSERPKGERPDRKAANTRDMDSIPRKLAKGRVLVHNRIVPQPILGVNGFRAWTQKGTGGLEVCSCKWAGVDLGGLVHYRVKSARLAKAAKAGK
ncbi:MAG: hypothetical protein ACRD20_19595 [Terriglobales bacterium]